MLVSANPKGVVTYAAISNTTDTETSHLTKQSKLQNSATVLNSKREV